MAAVIDYITKMNVLVQYRIKEKVYLDLTVNLVPQTIGNNFNYFHFVEAT
jgi:hypothetical protein